ncbi:acyl-CoA dehydrogenase [Marinobacterium nitratireducens]|uniref:Acyl-CoA dehydrogenase n=1 Tax=Marinobacterium nitratireducens TaxID=518897 RepID=A0A917ZF24_9GAMM|nr:acyl-CoA dehydrogenase family protein [Marinobacterium nitratireducens]GGO81846.1 acyl-CoA dehydrogenase [Marinobacterium nitratireducens]
MFEIFTGSETGEQVRREAQEFIESYLKPLEQEHGITYESVVPIELLRQVWKASREAGLYGAQLPEELGGRGLSVYDYCLLKEDIVSAGAKLGSHVLGELGGPPRVGHLFKFATEEQLHSHFLPVVRAERTCCFALTEPNAGSDASRLETRAVKDGDHFVLNGQKRYISGAPYSDFAILMAVTDPDAGAKGVTAFLVDFDMPGVSLNSDYMPISGQRSHADIHLDNVRIPASHIIGGLGRGFLLGMSRINVNRLLHCPTMLGLARQALMEAVTYASRREQFGTPIASFQAIQHMLADMATELHAARSMMFDVAARLDRGEDTREASSMCKLYSSERAFQIADRAVQIHGGAGLMKGSKVEWIFRALRMYRIVTGTSEIQRNTIAKGLLKDLKASTSV